MAFYGYSGGVDDRYWAPYTSADHYEFGVPPQYSSPYDLGYPSPLDYTSSAYCKDHFCQPISYQYPCQTIYSQPKFLQYEPPPHYQGCFSSETKLAVSYSSAEEFSEAAFVEYDPTPYDGGYDQRMTYGKPLPPSDPTCYPRSLPQSHSLPLENFSYNSIPSPYGKEDSTPIEPPKRREPTDTKGETESHVENGGKDMSPMGDSPSYEHQKGFETGRGGDYAHVSQIPYGSGSEAMDMCESIFGYWPCLAKKAQQQRNSSQVGDQDRRMDPWEAAADYFFGSRVPYDHDNYRHPQSHQVSLL